MHPYSLAILVLLVTGHDTVTSVIPLVFLSPFLIVSALVIFTHAYASSVEFARHISGLYDRYETLNFYQPGYKSYSDRRHIALWQIAAEELIKKLEMRLNVQSGQVKNSTPTPSSTSLPLVPVSVSRLVPWFITFGSIVAYFSSTTLRDAIAVLVQASLTSLTAIFSRSIAIFVVRISALAGLLGTYRGLNLGVTDCLAFTWQIIDSCVLCYLDARILAILVCAPYIGITLLIPALQYIAIWLVGYWLIACTWVFVLVVFIWAYPVRARLYRCSKRAIASIGQSTWVWEELYDKDHDFAVEPKPEQKVERVLPSKIHVLRGERWPPVQQPACPNDTDVASRTPETQAGTIGSETRSRDARRMEAIATLRTRYLAAGFTLAAAPVWKPRRVVRYGFETRQSALSAISSPPTGIQQTASFSSPSSTLSSSPSASTGSSPQLTPENSAEIGAPTATYPSCAGALRAHGSTIRARAKVSPVEVPKWIVEARTVVGEEKVTAALRRSEWKQRAKLRKERKSVMETAMEVDESVEEHDELMEEHDELMEELDEELDESPMDVDTGHMEPGPVVQLVPAEENRVGGVVEPQAQPTLAPVSSAVDPPPSLSPVDAPEVVATSEPAGARQMKVLPRRRHIMAARSSGTDAPMATGGVASTSNELPVGSVSLSSNSGSTASTNHVETPTSTPPVPLILAPAVAPPTAPAFAPPAPPSSPSPSTPTLPPVSTTGPTQAPKIIEAPAVQPAPAMDTPTANPGSSSTISGLDILVSAAAAAAPAVPAPPTVPSAPPTSSATTPAIPPSTMMDSNPSKPVRMVPVYTWLMDDGTKRVMKKGEVIPARAKYTLKSEKGSKLMSVGAKPLRV